MDFLFFLLVVLSPAATIFLLYRAFAEGAAMWSEKNTDRTLAIANLEKGVNRLIAEVYDLSSKVTKLKEGKS